MQPLPTVPAPDGFDDDVAVRALLASLPAVDAPEAFEAELERRIANLPKPRLKMRRQIWWLVGVSIVGILGLFIGLEHIRPAPVEVVAASVGHSSVDLERLPPVAVEQDKRWNNTPPMLPRKQRRWPKVVTGY